MIKDHPLKLVKWLFILIEKFVFLHFSKVSYIGDVKINQDKATLVLMNHFSFYDGFMIYRFCRRTVKKQLRVMVVKAQLKAFILIKYLGSFSVDKKSRSLVNSLNYAASLLDDPKNMLTIFPQGELYSLHLNKIKFEGGIGKILQKKKKEVQIIFAVTLIDYLDSFKPKANFYYEEYTGDESVEALENAYNLFYKQCKVKQQQLHNPPLEVLDNIES